MFFASWDYTKLAKITDFMVKNENIIPALFDRKSEQVQDDTALEALSGSEIVGQYLITVKDYVEQGYAAKVANGEVEVFDVMPPPLPNASLHEKLAWERIISLHGNGMLIRKAEKRGEGYYMNSDSKLGRLGVSGEHKLVVFSRSQ